MKNGTNVVFGTGPLGMAVMEVLKQNNKSVVMVNRSGMTTQPIPEGVEIVKADATNLEEVVRILDSAEIVFHCAMPPYTKWPQQFPALTQGIMQGALQTSTKLIYGDNLYMYGPTGSNKIDEELPYKANGQKGKVRSEMAKSQLECAQQKGLKLVIGRGSDFFGPNVIYSGLGESVFKAALQGKPVNLLGNISKLHTYTYIKDFARGLVRLSTEESALGQVWHIPNAPTISTQEVILLLESKLKQPIKIRSAGRFLVSLLGLFNPMLREMKEMMYEWEDDFVVDHTKFTDSFDFEPTTLKDALEETLTWYQSTLSND